MIRFPNPGTDVDAFIDTFKILYSDLNQFKSFDLDMISKSMADSNRAASEGNIGSKALKLSTRDDRTRDPMYNNSKMYAELYRTLGWISSTPKSNLEYEFTFLGAHVGSPEINSKLLFDECLFGINYPNQVLNVKSKASSRTMALILQFADRLDGYITRDEIIIGPMDLDESDPEGFNKKLKLIIDCRRKNSIADELEHLSKKLRIQINTLRNYTRFPISVLTTFGYFEKKSPKKLHLNIRDKVIQILTIKGKEKVKWLKSCFDVRLNDVECLNYRDRDKLIQIGFYQLLSRSNFDISTIVNLNMDVSPNLEQKIGGRPVLFSPYQTLYSGVVDKALGVCTVFKAEKPKLKLDKESKISPTHANVKVCFDEKHSSKSSWISDIIEEMISQGQSDDEIVNAIYKKLEKENKDVFYSAVVDLFCIIGFDCSASRSGINYERWDAIIKDSENSIPIEIKSPREEKFISIKAIRQALENKIVLLSRRSYKTKYGTVTLAVGYNAPNDRAEVAALIEDIYKTYNIRVGVMDTCTLIELAVRANKSNFVVDKADFITLRGILDANDL